MEMEMEDYQQSTQTTPPSKNKSPKPRKLRMSCDNCSYCKVKCDQTRPSCQRCIKLGTQCHYSPSQRMGKRPAASKDPRRLSASKIDGRSRSVTPQPPYKTEQETDSSSGSGWNSDSSDKPRHSRSNTTSTSTSVMDTSFLPDESIKHSNSWSDFSLASWSESLNMDSLTPPLDTPNSIPTTEQCRRPTGATTPDFPQDFNIFDMSMNMNGLGLDMTFPTQLSTTAPLVSRDTAGCQSLSCISIVQTTLQSLTLDGAPLGTLPICTRSGAGLDMNLMGASSVDKSLITNKMAVDLISTVLTCSCISSGQLSLTMAVIMDRILSRYQDILREVIQGNQNDFGHSLDNNTAVAAPLTLGLYHVDADDQRRILMHVVSSDLRKAINLTKDYINKHLLEMRRNANSSELVSGIAMFLKQRVNESTKEMTKAVQSLSVAQDMFWS